jgi:hypothetical protein
VGSSSSKNSSEGVKLGFKGVEVGFGDGVGGRLLLSRAGKGVGGGTSGNGGEVGLDEVVVVFEEAVFTLGESDVEVGLVWGKLREIFEGLLEDFVDGLGNRHSMFHPGRGVGGSSGKRHSGARSWRGRRGALEV